MKIKKKFLTDPIGSSMLWMIPTTAYLTRKLVGGKFNNLEWLWWVTIPSLMVIWFFINFKIEKDGKKSEGK
jgi:hypothetical protein